MCKYVNINVCVLTDSCCLVCPCILPQPCNLGTNYYTVPASAVALTVVLLDVMIEFLPIQQQILFANSVDTIRGG